MTLRMRPRHFGAHRHHDRRARVGHFDAAHEALGGVHGDGAHHRLAQVLRDLSSTRFSFSFVMLAFESVSAFRILGSLPGGNSTSTTGPITWMTLPLPLAVLLIVVI